jgi:hypothetical protein
VLQIDVLPRLQPRISRRTVEDALALYERLTTASDDDAEMRSDAYDELERLEFYLTAEQCERINRLEAAYWQRRLETGGIALTGRTLRPHPQMDDSYFAD